MQKLVAILLTVFGALSLGACASTSATNEMGASGASRHAVVDCAITEWSGKCPY
jgi:hypothetical protein